MGIFMSTKKYIDTINPNLALSIIVWKEIQICTNIGLFNSQRNSDIIVFLLNSVIV